jgi:hypothetical protein
MYQNSGDIIEGLIFEQLARTFLYKNFPELAHAGGVNLSTESRAPTHLKQELQILSGNVLLLVIDGVVQKY